MAFDQEVGSQNIRTTIFDGAVKGFAERQYKFKQACLISPSSAWKNYFFREKADPLAGQSGNAIRGIPRGANFPQAVVAWERVLATIEKYGLEDNIQWEDIITGEVDVRNRTLRKIAEGVAKAVDDQIWSAITGETTIQVINIAATKFWNGSSAAIIDDLLQAKQLMGTSNYDTSNCMAFVSPRDYRSILNYLAEKGAQFPSIANEVATNGKQGELAGIQLVVSNSVTASQALVVIPKICATWKELVPLTTITKEDHGKSVLVRSYEYGVTQVTDPQAIVWIKGTQGT